MNTKTFCEKFRLSRKREPRVLEARFRDWSGDDRDRVGVSLKNSNRGFERLKCGYRRTGIGRAGASVGRVA